MTGSESTIDGVKAWNGFADTLVKTPAELEAIGEDLVRRMGPDSPSGYRIMQVEFRDVKKYETIDLGTYIADEDAARAWNKEAPPAFQINDDDIEQLPEGGDFSIWGFSQLEATSASANSTATATAQ